MNLANFLVERRVLLAVLTLLAAMVLGWGVTKTRVDSSSDAILPEDDPYAAQVEAVQQDFPRSSSALFTFIAPDGDIFNRSALGAMEALLRATGLRAP